MISQYKLKELMRLCIEYNFYDKNKSIRISKKAIDRLSEILDSMVAHISIQAKKDAVLDKANNKRLLYPTIKAKNIDSALINGVLFGSAQDFSVNTMNSKSKQRGIG